VYRNVYFLSVGSQLGLGRGAVEVVVVDGGIVVTGYTPQRRECENIAQDVCEHIPINNRIIYDYPV